jgi:hypothetical protein
VAAGAEHELDEVGRAVALEGLDRLADLERVSDRGPEWLVHVGELADDLTAGSPAELDHGPSQLPGGGERLHEGAVADLHVEDDRVGATGDLLRHDRRGDQRDDVDGRRDVAERVEPPVGRNEVGGLADDRHPDLADLADELVALELDAEARDRLELVERPAGVAEPAPAHLREGDAAGGHDRAEHDRRLVPDAAGGVLVDDAAAEAREIDRLTALHHRVGERERLRRGEPPEVRGHAEGRHLVVRDLVAGVGEHELGHLLGGELAAVALSLDQLGRPDHAACGAPSSEPSTLTARAGACPGAPVPAPCRPPRR